MVNSEWCMVKEDSYTLPSREALLAVFQAWKLPGT